MTQSTPLTISAVPPEAVRPVREAVGAVVACGGAVGSGVAAAAPPAVLLAGGAVAAVPVQGAAGAGAAGGPGLGPPAPAPSGGSEEELPDAPGGGSGVPLLTWDRGVARGRDAAGTAGTGGEDGADDCGQRKGQRRG